MNESGCINLESFNVHCVAGALKKYLRELPNPVIPVEMYGLFIDTARKCEVGPCSELVLFQKYLSVVTEVMLSFKCIIQMLIFAHLNGTLIIAAVSLQTHKFVCYMCAHLSMQLRASAPDRLRQT